MSKKMEDLTKPSRNTLYHEHRIRISGTGLVTIHRGTKAEECASLGPDGNYRVGLIGAFSYFGKRCDIVNTRSIGRYCSFGQDILAGAGPHPTDWLTTSNFSFRRPAYCDHPSVLEFFENRKLPAAPSTTMIEVGNDVWCGSRAVILTGVKIGTGAIIAANATVTKDVPPYAIVAGTPARILRYRINENLVTPLLESEWWDIAPSLMRDVDMTDVQKALAQIAEIKEGHTNWRFSPKIIDIAPFSA